MIDGLQLVQPRKKKKLPDNDGTAACTFICLKMPEKFLRTAAVSEEEIAGTLILRTLATFSPIALTMSLENTLIFTVFLMFFNVSFLQNHLFIEIFFTGNWLSVRRVQMIGLEKFLYKLMVNLYARSGTDILPTDRLSVYMSFMSSEKLGISQSNSETPPLTPFFLKFETPVNWRIALSRNCILITNFLT